MALGRRILNPAVKTMKETGVIADAEAHTSEDGVLYGCGYNINRCLGIDGDNNRITPVKCDFDPFITVNANFETCSISRDGQLQVNGVTATRLNVPIKLAT